MPPDQPPEGEKRGWQEDDEEPPQTWLPSEDQIGDRSDEKDDSETGEGDRYDEQTAGDPIAPLVLLVEREEHPQPRCGRSEVAELEGPEKILESGTQKEDQHRREQREPIPCPRPEVGKEQHRARQE